MNATGTSGGTASDPALRGADQGGRDEPRIFRYMKFRNVNPTRQAGAVTSLHGALRVKQPGGLTCLTGKALRPFRSPPGGTE